MTPKSTSLFTENKVWGVEIKGTLDIKEAELFMVKEYRKKFREQKKKEKAGEIPK